MGGGFIEFLFGDGQQQAGRYPAAAGCISSSRPTNRSGRCSRRPTPQQSMPEPEQASDPTQRPFDPKYEKQLVDYHGKEGPGTIVIDTPNKFLFLVQGDGKALRYGIGVGKPGFTWSGVKTISAKKEWPDWTPPAEMLVRRPDLPRHMEGGPQNPLGARAMYLGSSLYRIHGSNEPWTIGTNVSSGCIRMRNRGRDRPLRPRQCRRQGRRDLTRAAAGNKNGRSHRAAVLLDRRRSIRRSRCRRRRRNRPNP